MIIHGDNAWWLLTIASTAPSANVPCPGCGSFNTCRCPRKGTVTTIPPKRR